MITGQFLKLTHRFAALDCATSTIEDLLWRECIARYDRPHTLIYLDPPYWQMGSYGVPLKFDEYKVFAEFIRTCKGQAMLSINDHPDIQPIFEGWPMLDLSIKYSVASNRGSPKPSQELVVSMGGKIGGLF